MTSFMLRISRSKYFRRRMELLSALGILFWGLILLNPFVHTFERYPNLAEMARHGSEIEWGAWGTLTGLISFVGIVKDNKFMRHGGMLGALTFRTFLLFFIGLQTGFTSPGLGDQIIWCVLALGAYYRIDNEF